MANVLATAIEQKRGEAEREELIGELAQERARLADWNTALEPKVRECTGELVQSNRELEAARDRFRTLFNASPIPICITRLSDGQYVDVNDTFLAYFDWEREEVIGHTSQELSLWQDVQEREAWVGRLGDKGMRKVHEAHFVHPSGERRTTLSSVRMIDIGGERCVMTVFVDITERAQAEEKVRNLASELVLAEPRERRRVAQILHDEIRLPNSRDRARQ